MSTLINLLLGIVMGALCGSHSEVSNQLHNDAQQQKIEILQDLELRQKILEC